MDDNDWDNEVSPDDGEDNLEQWQPEDTLVDRGVKDVLDEGYIAPDDWSPAQGFGNTPAEMRRGETLEQRRKQELPEAQAPDDTPWNPQGEKREVGSVRAGRLVATGDGTAARSQERIASAVGIDGGAASAEEAAMHIIEPEDDDEV